MYAWSKLVVSVGWAMGPCKWWCQWGGQWVHANGGVSGVGNGSMQMVVSVGWAMGPCKWWCQWGGQWVHADGGVSGVCNGVVPRNKKMPSDTSEVANPLYSTGEFLVQ